MRIKNWKSYQHYTKRSPPWIKLHRTILNDKEIHNLPGDAFKTLVGLWLIASETSGDGTIPDSDSLAFRLRIPRKVVEDHITLLNHWLESDASIELAGCKQDATPEERRGETEAKTEIEKRRVEAKREFNNFGKKRENSFPLPSFYDDIQKRRVKMQ